MGVRIDRQIDAPQRNFVDVVAFMDYKTATPTQTEVSQADYKMHGMQPSTFDSKFPFILLKKKKKSSFAQSDLKIAKAFCGQCEQ